MLSGLLIFNPLTYVILKIFSWRWSYIIYSVVILVLGLGTTFTFKSINNERKAQNNCEAGKIKEGTQCHELVLSSGKSKRKSYETMSIEMTKCESLHKEAAEKNVTITRRAKVFLCSIWFLSSILKCLAYYIPDLILVSFKFIFKIDLVLMYVSNMLNIKISWK